MMGYPKILRIPLPKWPVRRKMMAVEDAIRLFDGKIIITEKLDGKTMSRCHGCMTVYYEYVRDRHSVFYDELPSFEVAFDVWDDCKDGFLPYWDAKEFAYELGYVGFAPILFENRMSYGEFQRQLPKYIHRVSSFASKSMAEGIVVKNYSKQLFGKVVNPAFEEGIHTHWLKEPLRRNRLYITTT